VNPCPACGAVALDPRARRALGLAVAYLPTHAIVVDDRGHRWRVRCDGGIDLVVQGGLPHGGIAADPTAGHA